MNVTDNETGATVTVDPSWPTPETESGQACPRRAVITLPREVRTQRPSFLKTDWYPLGVLSLVSGVGGIGKSSLVLADVAAGTRGRLPGDYDGEPVKALITAAEDDKGLQSLRLKAAGADPDRWGFLDITDTTGGYDYTAPLRLPSDQSLVRQSLIDFGARLWVIDPLSAALVGDLNSDKDVNDALVPLAALAEELNIAVVIVHHFSKGGGRASDKIKGSGAIRDRCRSALLVAADNETGERVITCDKSNYSDTAGLSWAYTLESAQVADDNGEVSAVPVAHVTGSSSVSVSDIINRVSTTEEDLGERASCATWLDDWLRGPNTGGCLPAREVFLAAKTGGRDYSKSTVHRARRSLHLHAFSTGHGPGSTTYWCLPESCTHPDACDRRDDHAELARVEEWVPATPPSVEVAPIDTHSGPPIEPNEKVSIGAMPHEGDPHGTHSSAPTTPRQPEIRKQNRAISHGHPQLTASKTCTTCGNRMIDLRDGATTHPNCGPDEPVEPTQDTLPEA
ncbi:MAG: AAA family ATPase [Cutibacterium avidum]|nr:AAA family ATPase [Cutibacterium avidum]